MKARVLTFLLVATIILFGATPKPAAIPQQIQDLQHQVAILQFQELQDQQNIANLNAWITYFNYQLKGNGPEKMQERDKGQDKF